MHHPHALAAAAGGGLHQDREADLGGAPDQVVIGEAGSGDAGHHGHAERRDRGLGGDLVAHRLDRGGGWADERDACRIQRGGEFGVLGEESVAGVDGLRAGAQGRVDDGVDVQVALPGRRGADPHGDVGLGDVAGTGVGVTVDGDGTNSHGPQRADDPHGDLSAVGDQDGVEGLGGHPVTS